jgi:uncharacterized membrane protein YecN with MAPEG domain
MPAITALYAGLIGLLLFVAALRISQLRRRLKIGLGDGGDRMLTRAIRVHANLVEWGVPAAVLLLLAELNRAPSLFLHGCGIALIFGRLLHALALSRSGGSSVGRTLGSALSWGALFVLAVWDIWAFVRLALI